MKTKHSFYRVISHEYMTFYCRACHERSDMEMQSDLFNQAHNSMNDIKCPKCNEVTEVSYNAGKKRPEERTFFNGMKFFEAKDSNKIRVFFDYKTIHFFNEKLQQEHFTQFFVLNLDTANTYQLKSFSTYGKKMNKNSYCFGPRSIFNMTFSKNSYSLNDTKIDIRSPNGLKLINLIEKKLSEKLGYKVKSIIEYLIEYNQDIYKDTINLKIKDVPLPKSQREALASLMVNPNIRMSQLAAYIRIPNLNPFSFKRNFDNMTNEKFLRKLKRNIKPFCDSPIKSLIKAFKLNLNKPSAKLIAKDIRSLSLFSFYSFIKDKNNLYTVVSYFANHESFNSSIYTNKRLYDFLKKVYDQVGEKQFVCKIVNSNKSYHTFDDSARMYFQILDRYEHEEDGTKFEFDFRKKNINEIHDELTMVFNRLTHESKEFFYDEEAFKLESSFENYNIVLPKTTLELINIGHVMGICVGSYGHKVLSKSSTIIVWYEHKTPAICIEISNKCIVQAKLHKNKKPSKDQASMIRSWAKDNGLSVNTRDIEDLESIGAIGNERDIRECLAII